MPGRAGVPASTAEAMRLVLFDVDGTLTTGASAERLFVHYLLRRRRLGPAQIAAMLAFAARWAPRYGRHVFKKDKAYLCRLAVQEVAELARDFVAHELIALLYAPACERLARHARDGDVVALLTGAPQFIADPLAQHLGVQQVCATRCATRGGRFTTQPPLRHPFGEEKVALARELARQAGLGLDAALAYADSGHDIALLEAVGHPVAVRPDRALRQAASARGWEVLEASSPAAAT